MRIAASFPGALLTVRVRARAPYRTDATVSKDLRLAITQARNAKGVRGINRREECVCGESCIRTILV